MSKPVLQRAAEGAQVVAALALATLGVRFGVWSTWTMWERDQRPPTAVPTSGPTSAPPSEAATATPAPAGPPGAAIRPKLVVHGKRDRSEVRVDGGTVGRSPYLGEVSCRSGDVVVIEIVPPTGPSTTHERPCTAGTIRVDER